MKSHTPESFVKASVAAEREQWTGPSAPDNGGPAFPEVVTEYHGSGGDYTQDVHSVGGMYLRDYFAASVLPECFKRHAAMESAYLDATVAKRAYEIADAMLSEREKP